MATKSKKVILTPPNNLSGENARLFYLQVLNVFVTGDITRTAVRSATLFASWSVAEFAAGDAARVCK